jgi:hypothetical protein
METVMVSLSFRGVTAGREPGIQKLEQDWIPDSLALLGFRNDSAGMKP